MSAIPIEIAGPPATASFNLNSAIARSPLRKAKPQSPQQAVGGSWRTLISAIREIWRFSDQICGDWRQ
jgi:hypothetical protein